MPSADIHRSVDSALFELWERVATFPASETDAALTYLQEWIAERIGADNVVWIGAVKVLGGTSADPFLGWRLRSRVALRPDPEPYQQQVAEYFDSEHLAKAVDQVGMDSRALMAGCGKFRAVTIRDNGLVDFKRFEKTPHYQRYYLHGGIEDRIAIGFPISATRESFFLIDRFRATKRPHFSLKETTLAGDAVRGVRKLHKRLFLGTGLMVSDKVLSPVEKQIVKGLLTGKVEKEIAAALGQSTATLHNYVKALFTTYGVRSRPAFMALWLGEA